MWRSSWFGCLRDEPHRPAQCRSDDHLGSGLSLDQEGGIDGFALQLLKRGQQLAGLVTKSEISPDYLTSEDLFRIDVIISVVPRWIVSFFCCPSM